MKNLYIVKQLFFVVLLFAAGMAKGQVHPLAFGPHGLAGSTTLSNSNWYRDYVGARLIVTAPTSIQGDKQNMPAAIGTGTGSWPDIHDTMLVNKPIIMDTTADSFVTHPFAYSMSGHIAVVWRGRIDSPVSFTYKAWCAQQAGALACVIINEVPGNDPFSPGYTTGVGVVRIPVIMISNPDGIAISSVYHSSAPNTVKMTISPWGQGYLSDLGLCPGLESGWHAYAVPYNQFAAGASRWAYKGVDGSFIANFGSNNATHTTLASELSFTPNSTGTPTVQHRDTLTLETDFTGVGTTDTLSDSVYAMFPKKDYTMTAPGPGRFDLKYTVYADAPDQYPGDNTATKSFYLTDSLYSKGRYDFVRNIPLRATYEGFSGGAEITWGPMYYVAKGGTTVDRVQYSVANNGATHPSYLSSSHDILIFKWVDGSNSQPGDSLVQDGELELVSMATHNDPTDTSECTITHTVFNDPSNSHQIKLSLDSNTWYYVAIDLTNSSSSDPQFLGVDGVTSPYPRVYARWQDSTSRLDYSSFVGTNASGFIGSASQYESPIPFTQVSFIGVVDSFSITSMKGVIPAVVMYANNHPAVDTTPVDHTNVGNVQNPVGEISVFPNPASDYMNVTLNLNKPAGTVTYKVIDGLARTVSKESHYNVQGTDTYTINTSCYRAGNYYLMIYADGKSTSKKFTVTR